MHNNFDERPKGLLTRIGEAFDQHRMAQRVIVSTQQNSSYSLVRFGRFLPTPGNMIFTLLVIGSLLWAQNVGAISLGAPLAATTSITGIPYQGRLADKNGAPLTQTVNMTFRLYSATSGGAPFWEEPWTGANSVQVSDGLFNVMLGSVNPIGQAVITGNSNLFLGITVGTDGEMSPRVQLGSVPFATQALTVPDGSITSAKLSSDVLTSLQPSPRIQTTSVQMLSDNIGGVTTNNHLGPMARFDVGHSRWARGAIKLPSDWVSGTDIRFAIAAKSLNSSQTVVPKMYWATLNEVDTNWEVINVPSPAVTIGTGFRDVTVVTIASSNIKSGDTIAIAFNFPGNTQIIDATGLYLEYTAQP